MSFLSTKIRLSLRGYLLYCIAAVISVPLAYPQSIESLALGLSIGVASALLVGLLSLIANEIAQAINRDFNLLSIVLLALGLGLIRGVFLYYLTQAVDLSTEIGLATWMARSAVTTGFWFTLAAHFAETSERFTRTFQALQNQLALQVGLEASSNSSSTLAESLKKMSQNLQAIGEDSRNRGFSDEGLKVAATRLRHEIENVIRPASHSLWLDNKSSLPEVKFSLILRNLFIDFDLNIWRVVITSAALNLIGGLGTLTWERNLLNLTFAASLGLFIVIRRPIRGLIGIRLKVVFDVLWLALVSVVPLVLTELLIQSFGFRSYIFPVTTFLILLPLVTILILLADAMLLLVESDREAILKKLRLRVAELQVRPDRSVAGYLHNNLQSELNSLVLQLETGIQNPDSKAAFAAWERLGALINKSIAEDFESSKIAIKERFQNLQDAWSGIAELTLSLDRDLWEDEQLAVLALQIVEESLSNSVRHLRASQVTIELTIGAQNIMIIQTNGTPKGGAAAGMGSAWLKEVSLPGGKFEVTPTGTRLRIIL